MPLTVMSTLGGESSINQTLDVSLGSWGGPGRLLDRRGYVLGRG